MVASQPRLRSPLNPLNVTSYGLFSSSSSSSRICASSNRVIYRSLDPPTFSILSVETLENVFARRGTATIPPSPAFSTRFMTFRTPPLMDSWRGKWNKSRDFVARERSIVYCRVYNSWTKTRIYLTENFLSCSWFKNRADYSFLRRISHRYVKYITKKFVSFRKYVRTITILISNQRIFRQFLSLWITIKNVSKSRLYT